MHLKLKVLRGASAGKEIAVKGPKFFIGRSEECNLRANSDAISRRHCAISVTEESVLIRDLGSRNGTYVNGNRIEGDHQIEMGDQLRVGPLEFLVTYVASATTSPKSAPVRAKKPVGSDDEMDGLVGNWLEEAEETDRSTRSPDRETREFRLDDTNQVRVPANGTSVAAPTDDPSTDKAKSKTKDKSDSGSAGDDSRGPVPKKSNRQKDAPKDTQEAAAQMLRKFFNRG